MGTEGRGGRWSRGEGEDSGYGGGETGRSVWAKKRFRNGCIERQ